MASMRDIRTRIKSVNQTMQITNAMNLIASSKLKKARKQLNDAKPYFEKVQYTIQDIVTRSPDISHRYFAANANTPKRIGLLIITADKGLCGSFNHNAIRLAESSLADKQQAKLFIIGHMGRDYFRRRKFDVDPTFLYTAQSPTLYRSREIAELLVSLYDRRELDEIYVVYTKMESAVTQQPYLLKLLPLEKSAFPAQQTGEKYRGILNYQPSPEKVLDILVPNYLKGLLFGTLVESFCSEQSARMTAMDAATNNARDMIKKLTLQYNRARQAAITQEISEIVGGADALM